MKSLDDKKIITFFDEWASSDKHKTMEKGHVFAVNEILSLIAWPKTFTFLDIGCGNGWVVREITKRHSCTAAYGIDMTRNMIEYATSHKKNEKEHFICESFLTWVSKKTFDVIFSMEALYYFSPLDSALKKTFSLLMKNGFFCFGIDYYKENPLHKTYPNDDLLPKNLYSIREWVELFNEAGFKNIKTLRVLNPNSTEKWEREAGTLVLYGRKS